MNYGLRDEFFYFQCDKCGCLQISEFPRDMSRYYPGNYYRLGKYEGKKFKGIFGGITQKVYDLLITGNGFMQRIVRPLSGENYYYIFQGLNVNRETKILDVGCGSGKRFL